jgi:(2Fe-2S) ferredoxin
MTTHVLVGTSPADAARRAELGALADKLDAELAFLQLASPTLGDVLERLARSRESEVVLVGVSAGPGGPGVSWLRRVAADWWRAFGDGAPRVRTAPAFMDDTSQWRALVERARPITHGGPGLTSDAWDDVPGHRHQVFVCRGPRCTAAGAEHAWRGVVLGLMGAGLGDDDVLVTQTGCQFPCNRAPVISVQPDDVWYGSVDEEEAGAIVSQHLVAGTPVERLRLPRRRKA